MPLPTTPRLVLDDKTIQSLLLRELVAQSIGLLAIRNGTDEHAVEPTRYPHVGIEAFRDQLVAQGFRALPSGKAGKLYGPARPWLDGSCLGYGFRYRCGCQLTLRRVVRTQIDGRCWNALAIEQALGSGGENARPAGIVPDHANIAVFLAGEGRNTGAVADHRRSQEHHQVAFDLGFLGRAKQCAEKRNIAQQRYLGI